MIYWCVKPSIGKTLRQIYNKELVVYEENMEIPLSLHTCVIPKNDITKLNIDRKEDIIVHRPKNNPYKISIGNTRTCYFFDTEGEALAFKVKCLETIEQHIFTELEDIKKSTISKLEKYHGEIAKVRLKYPEHFF